MSAQLSLGGSLTVSEAAAFVLCLSRSHAFWLALAGTTRYQAGQGDIMYLLGLWEDDNCSWREVFFPSYPPFHFYVFTLTRADIDDLEVKV